MSDLISLALVTSGGVGKAIWGNAVRIRRYIVEICALLEYYAAQSGNSILTPRDNLSVPGSRVKKPKKNKL